MHKKFLLVGSMLAALAVVLGAFGAHGLKEIVEQDSIQTFQTGVQYQMYHALALLLILIKTPELCRLIFYYRHYFIFRIALPAYIFESY